jgi:hypothetical protein
MDVAPTPTAQTPAPARPAEEISSRTVLMLVVLTLVVSFLGAFVSLTQLSHLSAAPTSQQSAGSQGQVEFMIAPPAPPMADTATGKVTLEISGP